VEANDNDIAAATVDVENRIKMCFMLGGANNEKFSSLKNHLENQYIMNEDQYPSDSESLLGMMNNFRVSEYVTDHATPQRDTMDDGVVFAQKVMNESWKKQDITAPKYPHIFAILEHLTSCHC